MTRDDAHSRRVRRERLRDGDYVRFADPQGADLARVSISWLSPEDRGELARRLGQLIDREHRDVTAWPPRLAADADPVR
jgi:hypothetical protein